MHVSIRALISQWEHGEKPPAGASLKLLTLVQEKGLVGDSTEEGMARAEDRKSYNPSPCALTFIAVVSVW